MKHLFFAPAIIFLLISCLGGTIGTETPGIPRIEGFRIVGYDVSSEEYVEKYTFYNSWDHRDLPYLEIIVYDDDLDINEITIMLNNDAYPEGERNFIYQLYQSYNPQIYRYRIEVTQNAAANQDNIWYLQFFVTDKNGKKSKTYTSSPFTVLPY